MIAEGDVEFENCRLKTVGRAKAPDVLARRIDKSRGFDGMVFGNSRISCEVCRWPMICTAKQVCSRTTDCRSQWKMV